MNNWTETKTINKYTKRPNKQLNHDGFQAIVYRRQNGWSYTVRALYSGDRWIQMSMTNKTFKDEEIAMLAAQATIVDLQSFLETVPA